jgi:hypothetical protein
MANGASKSSKAAPSQAKTTSFLSTEKVDESDLESGTESESTSESEDEADDKLAIKPTKSNGTQERPILPQSKSIKAKAEPVNGRAASSGKAENHDETSSSEEEDEESSGSEEKSGSESADSVHEEQSPQDAAEQISKDDPPARPKQPIVAYKPPVGFEKIGANPESRNAVAQFFSAASVKGKQLWYITAPAAVPISVIKEVSLEKVQRGAPAITHNGVEYGFVADQVDETGQTRVMVPESNGKGYRLGEWLWTRYMFGVLIVSRGQWYCSDTSPTASCKVTWSARPELECRIWSEQGHNSRKEARTTTTRRP